MSRHVSWESSLMLKMVIVGLFVIGFSSQISASPKESLRDSNPEGRHLQQTYVTADIPQLLIDVDSFYQDKKYNLAFERMTAIEKLNPEAAMDWRFNFNMGNILFKLGNVGPSIHRYRVAQKLSPRDSDISTNIKLAKETIVDKNIVGQINEFTVLLSKLTFNEATVILIIVASMFNACLFFALRGVKGELIKNAFGILLGLTILCLICFGLKLTLNGDKQGVLISQKINVKAGPNETLSTLFVIHEGTEFSVSDNTSTWSEIKLPNGFTGWVPNTSFLSF